VDFQEEGAPLVITFGFYSANEPPSFGYYGRLKKLEMLSGQKINKILVRDKKYKWYHYGIEGFGDDVMEVTKKLNDIIEKLSPSKIFTMGQSMGGYAAILYGALLQVDKIIAFGALSCFQSQKLELIRDYRWMSLVKEVEKSPPKVFANDLVELLKNNPVDADIFYGIFPGHVDRTMAVNPDAVHMMQFYGLSQVNIYSFHEAEHAVSEYLRRTGVLDDMLLNRIFGTKLPEYTSLNTNVLQSEWMDWVYTNIKAGAWTNGIHKEMIKSGVDKDQAWYAIESVAARVYLMRYFD
jgi:pimeloyl-ACP methyl ester carboxylesterase